MTDEQSRGLELSSIPEIRRVWHRGDWFYSVVDVIAFLTGTENPQSYWSVLKTRMKAEGYNEALHPENALAHNHIDYIIPLLGMAPLLMRLVSSSL